MARYDDEATRAFVEKVAGLDNPDIPVSEIAKDPKLHESMGRQAFNLAKGVVVGGKKGLAKTLISRGVGVASAIENAEDRARERMMSKFAGLPVLKVYEYLNDRLGESWREWEPETIWKVLMDELGYYPTEELKNLIMCFQVISTTNLPFEDWSVFENVGHSLLQNPVHFSQVQPLEPDEIALTVKFLKMIRPGELFEDDILGYAASSAKNAGMVYLPDDLYPKGSQELLDNIGNAEDLRDRVEKLYPKFLKGLDVSTPIGVQMARLLEVREFVDEKIYG